MGKPVMYLAHDPIGNSETQVVEFDPALLAEAARHGIIFIAVDADGDRQLVSAEDVKPPTGEAGSLTLVQPVYVDDRMNAVLDVFDALAAFMFPATTLATEDAPPAEAPRDPIEVFSEKLTALREITKAGESR